MQFLARPRKPLAHARIFLAPVIAAQRAAGAGGGGGPLRRRAVLRFPGVARRFAAERHDGHAPARHRRRDGGRGVRHAAGAPLLRKRAPLGSSAGDSFPPSARVAACCSAAMRAMTALTRAPAAGVRVAAPRKAAAAAAQPLKAVASNRLAGGSVFFARKLRPVFAAAAGEDGYASSDDPEVASGKRKAPSSMNIKELQAEARFRPARRPQKRRTGRAAREALEWHIGLAHARRIPAQCAAFRSIRAHASALSAVPPCLAAFCRRPGHRRLQGRA